MTVNIANGKGSGRDIATDMPLQLLNQRDMPNGWHALR
jgi:hypothetical protein